MSIATARLYLLLWCAISLSKNCVVSFSPPFLHPSSAASSCTSKRQRPATIAPLLSSSLPTPTQEQTLDDYLPLEHPLHPLLVATAEACNPRLLDWTKDAGKHEAFRYEWGTWVDTDKLDAVQELLGEIRLLTGAYQDMMDENFETTQVGEASSEESGKETGKRIRIAFGKHWDVILYVLPKGA